MRNERERELGEPLTNRAGRPLARATSGCAGALGSSGGSVEADVDAASDRAAWCHAVQRAALNLGGGCVHLHRRGGGSARARGTRRGQSEKRSDGSGERVRCLRGSEGRMGASAELRVVSDRDSQLAQCAVREEALVLQREHAHAATAIVAVAASMPARGGRERDDDTGAGTAPPRCRVGVLVPLC